MFKNTKGSPFQFFVGIVRLSRNNFFPLNGPLLNLFDDLWMKERMKNLGPTFGFFGYCRREYFDTLKSFCYFRANFSRFRLVLRRSGRPKLHQNLWLKISTQHLSLSVLPSVCKLPREFSKLLLNVHSIN